MRTLTLEEYNVGGLCMASAQILASIALVSFFGTRVPLKPPRRNFPALMRPFAHAYTNGHLHVHAHKCTRTPNTRHRPRGSKTEWESTLQLLNSCAYVLASECCCVYVRACVHVPVCVCVCFGEDVHACVCVCVCVL